MEDRKLLIIVVCVVALLWLATPLVTLALYSGMTERGQFGDQFGSVNALFSGLAFAGLIYTVLLQQRQLELQRTELKLQRSELQLQREEMSASRAELANQVRMQRALFRATVAQVNVAAVNAQIEAQKMRSEVMPVGHREAFWQYIEKCATTLSELAEQLKSEANDDAG